MSSVGGDRVQDTSCPACGVTIMNMNLTTHLREECEAWTVEAFDSRQGADR